MKNYIIITLLSLGLLAGTTLSAQDYYGPRASKKDWKMHKKEGKIHKKMFNDRHGSATRKRQKARKKNFKMEMKHDMHR